MDAGRLPEAEDLLARGLAQRPGHLSARVMLGRVRLALGDEDGAREDLAAVLAQQPEHWTALEVLQELEKNLGHSGAEEALLVRMLKVQPGNFQLLDRLEEAREEASSRPVMPGKARSTARGSGSVKSPSEELPPAPLPQPGSARKSDSVDPFLNATMAEILVGQGEVAAAVKVYGMLLDRGLGDDAARVRRDELGAAQKGRSDSGGSVATVELAAGEEAAGE